MYSYEYIFHEKIIAMRCLISAFEDAVLSYKRYLLLIKKKRNFEDGLPDPVVHKNSAIKYSKSA